MNARETALRYLKDKGFHEEEVTKVIDFLNDNKLIGDEEYCIKYIRYCIERGRGPLRIKYELQKKGIDKEIIGYNLSEELDKETERESAVKHAEKLLKKFNGEINEKLLGRIGRSLSSNGFSSSIIYEIIAKYRQNS